MTPEKRMPEEPTQTPPPKRPRRQAQLATPASNVDEGERPAQFDLHSFMLHNNWVGKVGGYIWKTKTSTAYEVLNGEGKPLTILLFGKVNDSRVGRYGDYSPYYHESIIQPGIRNLIWKLSPPAGFADEFFKQYEGLQRLEQKLEENLELGQRACKNASEIELKRKIAKKIDSSTAIVPDDVDRDFWKKAKEARFCLNELPGGVKDLLKQPVPFEDWEPFFETNPCVVVNAIVRASAYRGKKYIQVVPTAIQEIQLDMANEDDNQAEIFDF